MHIISNFSASIKTKFPKETPKLKKIVNTISGALSFDDEDRGVKFVSSNSLPKNEGLTLTVTTDLDDISGNKTKNEFIQSFTYTEIDLIIYERTLPEVESIKLVSGKFYLEFSEEIDSSAISNAVF